MARQQLRVVANDPDAGWCAGQAGWCSMRFRFDEDELSLVRAAEQLRGAALAREGRPASLREALTLARLGARVRKLSPGEQVVLSEADSQLLLSAVRFAADEVRWLGEVLESTTEPGSIRDRQAAEGRRQALRAVFPDLVQRGSWRGYGLRRALEGLASRLSHPASV